MSSQNHNLFSSNIAFPKGTAVDILKSLQELNIDRYSELFQNLRDDNVAHVLNVLSHMTAMAYFGLKHLAGSYEMSVSDFLDVLTEMKNDLSGF